MTFIFMLVHSLNDNKYLFKPLQDMSRSIGGKMSRLKPKLRIYIYGHRQKHRHTDAANMNSMKFTKYPMERHT